MGLLRGFDLAGEAVLEAAACAIQAETKRAEGAAQSATWLPLLCLWLEQGSGDRCRLLLDNVRRLRAAADVSARHMQEVAAGAERTNAKGAEGATGNIPAAAQGRALLSGVVDKQTAASVVAVAGCVEAAT